MSKKAPELAEASLWPECFDRRKLRQLHESNAELEAHKWLLAGLGEAIRVLPTIACRRELDTISMRYADAVASLVKVVSARCGARSLVQSAADVRAACKASNAGNIATTKSLPDLMMKLHAECVDMLDVLQKLPRRKRTG